jgi:osmotically-inducible protein OsmY
VPNDTIRVKVEKGWVSLDGDVSWHYQRQAAQDSLEDLVGIKGIINNLKIKSEHKDEVEKKGIEDAIARSWSLNDCDIHVESHTNRITLSGTVNSYYQKMEAERIAWNAPGVAFVDNSLIIQFAYLLVE